MILNYKKIKLYFFVGGSLALFFIVLIASLILVFRDNFFYRLAQGSDTRYDFKNYDPGDPYLSKNLGLSDLLSGPIIGRQDPSLGPDDAPVNLVVFSDFACEFCREQIEIALAAQKAFPGQVRLIRKDYPETEDASFSFQAAVGGRCAAEQGKFWEYHNQVSALQEKNIDDIEIVAEQIGLDMKRFKSCQNEGLAWHLVLDNMEEANALEISGVPFIFVNKQEFLGGVSLEELKKAIKEELEKK